MIKVNIVINSFLYFEDGKSQQIICKERYTIDVLGHRYIEAFTAMTMIVMGGGLP